MAKERRRTLNKWFGEKPKVHRNKHFIKDRKKQTSRHPQSSNQTRIPNFWTPFHHTKKLRAQWLRNQQKRAAHVCLSQWRWSHRQGLQCRHQRRDQPSRPNGCSMSSLLQLGRRTLLGSWMLRQRLHRPRCWHPLWNQLQLEQLSQCYPSSGLWLWRRLCKPTRRSSLSRTPRHSILLRQMIVQMQMFPALHQQ